MNIYMNIIEFLGCVSEPGLAQTCLQETADWFSIFFLSVSAHILALRGGEE